MDDLQQGPQPISRVAADVMTEMILQRTNENLSSKPPQPQPSRCPTCDGFGWYIGVHTADNGTTTEHHVTCDCAAGRAMTARRNKHLLELSDLPERCRAWTFTGYNALALSEDQQIASKMVEEFAKTGQFKGHLGVYLHGSVGLGKSGLAAAAVNRAIKGGHTVLYVTVPNLLDHLRATYAPTAEVQYDELMDRIKSAELLVLDDLGTEVR